MLICLCFCLLLINFDFESVLQWGGRRIFIQISSNCSYSQTATQKQEIILCNWIISSVPSSHNFFFLLTEGSKDSLINESQQHYCSYLYNLRSCSLSLLAFTSMSVLIFGGGFVLKPLHDYSFCLLLVHIQPVVSSPFMGGSKALLQLTSLNLTKQVSVNMASFSKKVYAEHWEALSPD